MPEQKSAKQASEAVTLSRLTLVMLSSSTCLPHPDLPFTCLVACLVTCLKADLGSETLMTSLTRLMVRGFRFS